MKLSLKTFVFGMVVLFGSAGTVLPASAQLDTSTAYRHHCRCHHCHCHHHHH